MAGINKYLVPNFFSGKTLLEMGCGWGEMASEFLALGSTVTCADARAEYLEVVKTNYPAMATLQVDADKDTITENFDIVHHGGVLYHLTSIENHIQNLSNICKVLILESEVVDSSDPTYKIEKDEDGFDQAYNNRGIRPSAGYIENLLTTNGFQFRRLDDPIFNSEFHNYDWVVEDTNVWRHGLRRFWVCWKNTESPIAPGL
jgi:predicted TPR repeat methyltransferase